MKTTLLFLLMGLLCLGITGCESDSDDSPSATTTAVVTNSVTGEVQTNVVEAADAPVVEEPAGDADEALGAPVVGTTVTGKWIGTYENGGQQALLSLNLVQDGDQVTGTCSFSDVAGSDLFSGKLTGETLALGVYRAGIACSILGQVDFEAGTFIGDWADKAGNSGTFSLR